MCRFRLPCGLKLRLAGARLLSSRVRIPPQRWLFVTCVHFVLLAPLPRPNHSFRGVLPAVCLSEGDPATSKTRPPKPEMVCSATEVKIITVYCNHVLVFSEFTWWISTFFGLTKQNMNYCGNVSGKSPFLSCKRVNGVKQDLSSYPVEVDGCFSFSKCRARSSCSGCQTKCLQDR